MSLNIYFCPMRKSRKPLVILVLIAAFMVSPPGLRLALVPLSLNSTITDSGPDIICILGGGYNPDRVLGISTEERIQHALHFITPGTLRIHVIDYIGIHKSIYKNEVYRLFQDTGALKKISFHLSSSNTLDNCRVVSTIIQKDEPCLIVTSPYHVLRTRMILDFMDFTGTRVGAPDDSEVYSHDSVKQWQRNCLLIYREYAAIVRDFAVLACADQKK